MSGASWAEHILKQLKGENGSRHLALGGGIGPFDHWTLEEIAELTAAAADNKNLVGLDLPPGRLGHLTIAPFRELLRNTTSLEHFSVLQTYGTDQEGLDQQARQRQNLILFDQLLQAACHNSCFPLKKFRTTMIGDPFLFHQFLASTKLESLSVRNLHGGNMHGGLVHYQLSTEQAHALASGLRKLDSLSEVSLEFYSDHPSMLLVVNSLQGHPNLEEVRFYCQLGRDNAILNALFSLAVSCPKIKDLTISPPASEELDVAPLFGMRINSSLKCLHLSNLAVRASGFTHFLPSNKTLQTLELHDLTFGEGSLPVLTHFLQLEILVVHYCKGISADIVQVISALPNLQELDIDIGHGNEVYDEERNQLLANISEVVKTGPTTISFDFIISTVQVISDLVRGLQAREKPMKKLTLYFSSWEQGALELFSSEALPLLGTMEALQIDYTCGESGAKEQELCRFFERLPFLENLKYLKLGGDFPFPASLETANALLKYVENNEIIQTLDIPDFDDDLESEEDKIKFFMSLNKNGRRHLRNEHVPVGLWPHVLARISSYQKDSVIFAFLKTLNQTVDLFKNA